MNIPGTEHSILDKNNFCLKIKNNNSLFKLRLLITYCYKYNFVFYYYYHHHHHHHFLIPIFVERTKIHPKLRTLVRSRRRW